MGSSPSEATDVFALYVFTNPVDVERSASYLDIEADIEAKRIKQIPHSSLTALEDFRKGASRQLKRPDSLSGVGQPDCDRHGLALDPAGVARGMRVLPVALTRWPWRLPYISASQIQNAVAITFNPLINSTVCAIELDCCAAIGYLKPDMLAAPCSFFYLHHFRAAGCCAMALHGVMPLPL